MNAKQDGRANRRGIKKRHKERDENSTWERNEKGKCKRAKAETERG